MSGEGGLQTMPLLGAHMSIAGGYHKATQDAKAHAMDTLQLFTASPQTWAVTPVSSKRTVSGFGKPLTKSSNQWCAKELTEADIQTFQATLRDSQLRLLLAHDSY